jgi:hypothetical protein
MGLQKVCAQNQVPCDTAVCGHFNTKGIINGQNGGSGTSSRTDTTDTLGKLGSIPTITTNQNIFKTTVHTADTFGFDNLSVLDLDFNFEVTLDSGHRVNGNLDFFGRSSGDGSFVWLAS